MVGVGGVVGIGRSVCGIGRVLSQRLARAGRRARRPVGAALVCVAAAASLLPATAGAVPLAFGETMRVRFSLPAPPESPQIGGLGPDHPLNIADTLAGYINAVRISGFGAPSLTFTLYDGATLLGSYSQTFSTSTSFAFSGPTSPYTFRAGDAADLTALDDGTINGILDITSTSAAVFDYSVTSLGAGHGLSTNGYHPLTPTPIILSQERLSVAVPEPQTLLLIGTGLVLAFAVGRRRPRSRPAGSIAIEPRTA